MEIDSNLLRRTNIKQQGTNDDSEFFCFQNQKIMKKLVMRTQW